MADEQRSVPKRNVVVVGASAGGVEALSFLLQQLPGDFPAALAMTLHRSPVSHSILPQVLGRRAKLPCLEPQDGQPFLPGVAYVAPQDHHLLVRGGVLRVERGPKHHHSRPAIDPLFQSAAEELGSRVVGILLTGNLSDGVAGLIAIKEHGGVCMVQDPAEAVFPSMPRSALRYDHVDVVFRMRNLPRVLQAILEDEPVERVRAFSGASDEHA